MTDEQFDSAESFWTRKDAETKKMPEAELKARIDEFLSSYSVIALATASDDFIRCTPLEYSWHDGAIWIFTEGGLKFRALRKNTHVAAAVFETQAEFGALRSLQIEGEAEFPKPFSDEYNKAAEAKHIPIAALKKLPETMWLIKITPQSCTLLDSSLKKLGYGSRQSVAL